MGSSSRNKARETILAAAEKHFGTKVDDIAAPGGEGRASLLLTLADDREVFATLRPNFRRTHLEAFVLTELGQHCDDLPQCLGVVGEVMFQSNVGDRRLNVEIAKVGGAKRMALAEDAVGAIFRIHAAARQTKLHEMLPHLGSTELWMDNFVGAISFLNEMSGGISDRFDPAAVSELLSNRADQFVKWDCRSGNAAIDSDGRLRWFDFEYCGMRHGAEDLAWLIGDEAWPLRPDHMVDVIIDAYDPSCGHKIEDYLEYLSVYLTFHVVQRLKLITKEAKKRGWLSKTRIRRFDDAGVHPDFAAQICRVGAYFSAQSPLTECLSRNFEAAERGFTGVSATLKSA
ncbi:hypothetical protein AB2B41_09195 [Marimonas sp. MJW-29]|uniref:Aminoglycoside phosphotransferase domain-containing protein n=1 Tax=Sulfitobacter sediminis TaxID=3234186 RepID=A0ABV3RN34_9RHOB